MLELHPAVSGKALKIKVATDSYCGPFPAADDCMSH
jgi:hypothetical protein